MTAEKTLDKLMDHYQHAITIKDSPLSIRLSTIIYNVARINHERIPPYDLTRHKEREFYKGIMELHEPGSGYRLDGLRIAEVLS